MRTAAGTTIACTGPPLQPASPDGPRVSTWNRDGASTRKRSVATTLKEKGSLVGLRTRHTEASKVEAQQSEAGVQNYLARDSCHLNLGSQPNRSCAI